MEQGYRDHRERTALRFKIRRKNLKKKYVKGERSEWAGIWPGVKDDRDESHVWIACSHIYDQCR